VIPPDPVATRHHRSSLVRPLAITSVLTACVWLYCQPYFVLDHIRDAAKDRDRDALARLVDFPTLRENLKESFNAFVTKTMQESLAGNPFAGLGMLLGVAMVDRYVDAYVSPSGILMLTQGERPDPDAPRLRTDTNHRPAIKQAYRSASTFYVTVRADTSESEALTFVLRRHGLAWMLSDILIPQFEQQPTTEVDSVPEPVQKVTPRYPEAARIAGVDGTVMVQALVGVDGAVRDTRIAHSIPMLDDAAVEAVKQWRFTPAIAKDKPVEIWVAVPVHFSLR